VNHYDKVAPDLILKYQRATADSVIQKLAVIEQNPRIIWRAIEDHYGQNFFKKIIEIDYGVNDEEMLNRVERGLKMNSMASQRELERIGSDFAKETSRLREEVLKLTSENELMQLGITREIAIQREKVEDEFENKYKHIYNEKALLLKGEIEILTHRLKKYEEEQERHSFLKREQFNKWKIVT
jgi:hypothetical protein